MKHSFWIFAVLALAFYLRIDAIHFGLPYLYHADEPIVVHHALAYGTGDLNPHYFKLPPLISYLLFFCYGLYFLILMAAGSVSDVAGFQTLFLSDPTSFYLIARVLFGAVLGTATVWVWYLLLRRYFSGALALAASFLLAANFLHVRNSHYLYLDVPLLLIVVLSFFPILSLLTQPKKGDYIRFGVLLGLAVATKYNGFFILIPFLYAHLVSCGRNWRSYFRPELIGAGVLSGIVFFLLNPFGIIDFPSFLRDLSSMHEFESYQGWTHHLLYSLRHAVGLPVLISALAGLLINLFRPDKKKFVFVVFTLVYYVLLVHFSEQHARYVFPLIPFVLFFAADFLDRLTCKLQTARRSWYVLAVLVIAAPSLAKVYVCNRLLAEDDIRTTALKWTEANLPSDSRIALDSSFFMPRLKPSLTQLEEKREEALKRGGEANIRRLDWMIEEARANPQTRYLLYFLNKNPDTEFLFAKPVVPYDVEALKKAGIEYVLAVRQSPDHRKDFYEALDRQAEKIHRFTPYRDPSRDWPISTRPLTGAPLVWEEFKARRQNGQIIDLYRLSSAS